MRAHIYIEGGTSKEDQVRCREAFRKLLAKMGFSETRRMPRLSACGGRHSAYDDFSVAHAQRKLGDYVGLLVDSEETVENTEETWVHLRRTDGWDQPDGALDDQVLLMTTCMETWIVADREALRDVFGSGVQQSALPPVTDLERRNRREIYDKLVHATRGCLTPFRKGRRSFEALGKVNPSALQSLPSFVRVVRVLAANL